MSKINRHLIKSDLKSMKPIVLYLFYFTLVILNNIALPPETSLALCNNSTISSFANNTIGYKGLLEGDDNSLGYTAGGSLTVDAAPIFCNFYTFMTNYKLK